MAEHLPNILVVLLTFGIWLTKVFIFCSFQLLIRWSLPRFRPDQLMQLGWQRLLPVSIANVLLAAGWILYRMS
jgi:NADH-quinone oxidoreductase subunit H